MIVSGFALYVLLNTSNGVEESIPAVYDSMEACQKAEPKYMARKDYVDSQCFYSPAIKVSKN